jgi:lysyl-tRNA synthetase class 2
MLKRAQSYFEERDVLAVDTPALSRFAASDPNIDSLFVQSLFGDRYFLNTSPEFCMKRLLADGYPDIYSICRVFRDGESGRRHSPEFTMIEWYRLGFELEEIIEDTANFIAVCLDNDTLSRGMSRIDYANALNDLAGIDPFDASFDTLADCVDADDHLRREVGTDRDAWLDLILSTIVAPQFERDRLTVIQHYPASQAALARLCPADTRVADRFEVFLGDMELANGYVELTDAAEQRRRIDDDLARRERLGRRTEPWDKHLIAALESGVPECAGVAVGLERLQMVLDRTDDIRDVTTFGYNSADD